MSKRIKTLKKHEWTPNYEVTIAGAAHNQTVEMLIDSGADEVSDINYYRTKGNL